MNNISKYQIFLFIFLLSTSTRTRTRNRALEEPGYIPLTIEANILIFQ